MQTWYFALPCVLWAAAVQAAPFTPASNDVVIASWPASPISGAQEPNFQEVRPDSATVLAEIGTYLEAAGRPGNAHLYGLAEARLKPLIDNNTDSADAWLAWAQVQQHQHQFDDAMFALSEVFRREPGSINAHLLAARLHLIQDKPKAASEACLRLLGHADLLTTTGCALEAAAVQGELEPSYRQLRRLVDRQGFPLDERGPWLRQILADMALRLGDPSAAEQWLSVGDLPNATVSYLGQWADVKLALGKYDDLLLVLQPIVENTAGMDDALLLRLALAEKQFGGDKWQTLLRPRMTHRQIRGDNDHASELARYYLDIDPQPKRALHWAQINWRSAREHSDRRLLERAHSANGLDEKGPQK